jgi:hypothetical protein
VTKQKKKGKNIIADQLEIRDFRLSATRLDAGAAPMASCCSIDRITSNPRNGCICSCSG